MNTTNIIKGKELLELGYPETSVMALALETANSMAAENSTEKILSVLSKVLEKPEDYLENSNLSKIAEALIFEKEKVKELVLTDPVPYKIYGADFIEEGAL